MGPNRDEQILAFLWRRPAGQRDYLKHPSLTVEFPTPKINCSAYVDSLLSINPQGEVTPCPCVPFSRGNVGQEPLSAVWRCHIAALRLESRGRCPVNDRHDRELLQEHCASVRAGQGTSASGRGFLQDEIGNGSRFPSYSYECARRVIIKRVDYRIFYASSRRKKESNRRSPE
jgi:hypothetical protein